MRSVDVESPSISPFLKWAGGKRWLVSSQDSIFPRSFSRYIEPFLGGGAVFFHLQPDVAILGDLNKDLIETYAAIRTDWKEVVRYLRQHQRLHSKSYYYKIRDARLRNSFSRAAKFIYLNRTCWNGLYRVNLLGRFNVPIGTKTTVISDEDDFAGVAKLLKRAELRHDDFAAIIAEARAGDLLFVDPPYTVQHNNNNFVKYNEKLFRWEDQVRLKECLVAAKSRGANIVLTNAYHDSVRRLYSDLGESFCLTRASIIAADAKNRGATEELLIRTS
jgi:DNA adenine methylase